MSKLPQHILLTSSGTGQSRKTTYSLDESQQAAEFSAFALFHLLPSGDRPTEVIFALTPEAKQDNWNQIRSEAEELNIKVSFVEIAGNVMPDDTAVFLERLAKAIPVGARLTLDVTRGLRHHAFLFYALAHYLGEFRGTDIAGVWYCRWEISKEPNVSRPFIDMKPALELNRWFHALAVFRETGAMHGVAGLVPVKQVQELFLRLSEFVQTGLPIEAGNIASEFLTQSKTESDWLPKIPLVDEIERQLLSEIEQLGGQMYKGQSKSTVQLDQKELDRQASFIDRYLKAGQLNLGFGLMREWIVNFIAMHQPNSGDWLDYPKMRKSIEHNIGGLQAVVTSRDGKKFKHENVRKTLSSEQKQWAKRWSKVCEIRNSMQHHGMKKISFESHATNMENLRKDWDNRSTWTVPQKFGGGEGSLLICPIGLTPGVLYSALYQISPDRLLILCSTESARDVPTAIAKAKFEGDFLELRLSNPLTGVGEFESLISLASEWLFQADEVHANLTGGTTLMGALVGELSNRAEREYQRPVRKFVLIDQRMPAEQRTDPWQLGDIHYMDQGPFESTDDQPSDTNQEEEV